jgi:hypothetical protein
MTSLDINSNVLYNIDNQTAFPFKDKANGRQNRLRYPKN